MLTVIHGNDTALSRKFLLEQKQKYLDGFSFEGEKVTITDLTQILEGGALFSESKTIFIEQLITKQKKNASYKEIMSYLEQQAHEHELFLWEAKELERGILFTLKTANVRAFKLPQSLFLLLDSLQPGNGKKLVSLFHETIETTEVEMVFFMLVRQVRILLALSASLREAEQRSNPPHEIAALPSVTRNDDISIDEIKKMQAWQMGKLQKQADNFGQEALMELHTKLFEIERKQKTGLLASPLVSTVDFLLLEV